MAGVFTGAEPEAISWPVRADRVPASFWEVIWKEREGVEEVEDAAEAVPEAEAEAMFRSAGSTLRQKAERETARRASRIRTRT